MYSKTGAGGGTWAQLVSGEVAVTAQRVTEQLCKRFGLDVRENFITRELLQHWNRLPGQVVLSHPGRFSRLHNSWLT